MCKCTPSKPGGRFCGVDRCSIDKWDYSQPFAEPVRTVPTPAAPAWPPAPVEQPGKRGPAPKALLATSRPEETSPMITEPKGKRSSALPPPEPVTPGTPLERRIAELQALPRLTPEERRELVSLLHKKFDRMPQNVRKVPY